MKKLISILILMICFSCNREAVYLIKIGNGLGRLGVYVWIERYEDGEESYRGIITGKSIPIIKKNYHIKRITSGLGFFNIDDELKGKSVLIGRMLPDSNARLRIGLIKNNPFSAGMPQIINVLVNDDSPLTRHDTAKNKP